MKHTTDFTAANFTTRHPTPAQIRGEIMDRLMADYEKHPQGGDVPFIPNRVFRLVDESVKAACAKYGVYQ